MAADDLSRRPPERRRLRDGCLAETAAQLCTEVSRLRPRQEQATEDRPERLGGDVRPCPGSDHLCRRQSLRSREAALFDRKARHVAGREDVVEPAYAAEGIGRDETVAVARNPLDRLALQAGERDDLVRRDRPARRERELSSRHRHRMTARQDRDSALFEECTDGVARRGAEEAEGSLFGGRDDDANVAEISLVEKFRREESELVERQRPADATRKREDDVADPAGAELGE
jgi:hypothetical protein